MPHLDTTTVMELRQSLPHHSGDIHSIAVHPHVIATASGSSLIRVFRGADLKEKLYSPLHIHKYQVIHCALTRDGKRLISTSMDGRASIVDTDTGKLLAYHDQPKSIGMRTCCLSSNNHLLALGACDGTISVVEMDTYKTLKTMSVNDDESILSLCFTPDTHWLLSGHSVTGDIRVFNAQYLSTKPVACRMTAHELGTLYLEVSPKYSGKPGECSEGIQFVSAGADCMVCLWSITYTDDGTTAAPRLTKLNTLVGHTAPVYCVKYSSCGDKLASCGGDFTVRLWNLEGDCVYVHVQAHTSFINSLAFGENDSCIYTGSSDKTVKVWAITDTFSLNDATPSTDSTEPLAQQPPQAYQPLQPPKAYQPLQPQSLAATYAPTAATPVSGARGEKTGVSSWSVDDVCYWLSGVGLSKYSRTFRDNDIDGVELQQLDKDVLEKELRIGAFGARSKILRALEGLSAMQAQLREDNSCPNDNDLIVPYEFTCPITHELMKDPVVASDGYSYERRAIESWVAAGKTTSPMTNAALTATTILPNHNLRILINKHQHSQSE